MNTFQSALSTQDFQLSTYALVNESGKIELYGTSEGLANGTEVNVLISDAQGNSTSLVAVVQNNAFLIENIETGMFIAGELQILSATDLVSSQTSLTLNFQDGTDPIVIDQAVLENQLMSVLGTAPALEAGTELTLIVRDSLATSITASTIVRADKSYSFDNISTQGLAQGYLILDLAAELGGTAISVTNAFVLELFSNVPNGLDKTLQALEDMPVVIQVADFGYTPSQGFTLTGVKLAQMPAQGTLLLNGMAVQQDQIITRAQLEAGQLTYQGAQDGFGSQYASLGFKVLDSRPTNSEALEVNTLSFDVLAVNDAAVIGGDIAANLVETNAVLSTSGTLTVSDIDSPATFVAQTQTAGSNGYGKFSLSANGAWTYTTNTALNELVAGQDYTDSFTAKAADGTSQLVTVTITGSNEAPVLNASAVVSLPSVVQDAGAPTSALAGQAVSDLFGLITDADSTDPKGIVVAAVNGYGTLYYSTNNGSTWQAASGIENGLELHLDGNSRVFFRPLAGWTGTADDAFLYRAWDQSNGVPVGSISLVERFGADSAYSTAWSKVGVTVTAPNNTVLFTSMTKDTSAVDQNADWLTSDVSAGRLVSGTVSAPLAAGEKLAVYSNGEMLGYATLNDERTGWAITDTKGYNTDWTYTAKVVDAQGQDVAVKTQFVDADTTAPAAVAITTVYNTSNVVVATASGTTQTANSVGKISGSVNAENGDTVTLYDASTNTLIGSTTVSGGTWEVTNTSGQLAWGTNTLYAVVSDPAGNTLNSAPFDVTVPRKNYSGLTEALNASDLFGWAYNDAYVDARLVNPDLLTAVGPDGVMQFENFITLDGKTTKSFELNVHAENNGDAYMTKVSGLTAGQTYMAYYEYGSSEYFVGKDGYTRISYFSAKDSNAGNVLLNGASFQTLTSNTGEGLETIIAKGAVQYSFVAPSNGEVFFTWKESGTSKGASGSHNIGNFQIFDDASQSGVGQVAPVSATQPPAVTPNPDIVTYSSGILDTLAGNDIISSNSTALQSVLAAGGRIDGAAGRDTLKLSPGTTLDLRTLTNNQTVQPIQEIEIFELQGTSLLTLTANNVLSLGMTNAFILDNDKVQLRVDATAANSSTTDRVQLLGLTGDELGGNAGLAGQWIQEANTVMLGLSAYKVYNHSTTNAQVLIQTTVSSVSLQDSPEELVPVTPPDNTAPVFSSGSAVSVPENTHTTTVVYDALANDGKGADVGVHYSLGGADATRFAIDANNGQVRFVASPNFEAPADVGANNVYNITVTATDASGNAAQQAVAISVTDAVDIGQSVISLGSMGSLSSPVTVDGRTYYYWNTGKTLENMTYDKLLDGLFKYDINGGQNPDVFGPTETYRFAHINGVKVALPTAGVQTDENGFVAYRGAATQVGTAIDSGNVHNTKYSDVLAVWDAYNGAGTVYNIDGRFWNPSAASNVRYYWTATPTKEDGVVSGGFSGGKHALVDMQTGNVTSHADNGNFHVMVEVLSAQAGQQSVIPMGGGLGKLYNPVQVEGKWYYAWDRDGSGSITGGQYSPDGFTADQLDQMFNKDIFGNTNPQGNMNERFRYATLSDSSNVPVKLAIPTYGGQVDHEGFANFYGTQNGNQRTPGAQTAISNFGQINPVYDDFAAIMDAGGVPWTNSYYKTATRYTNGGDPVPDQHLLYLNSSLYASTDWNYGAGLIALEVVKPNLAPVLTDMALSFGSAGKNSLPVGAVGKLVSELVGGVTDADATDPKGIAIIDIQAGGTLWYSTNGGSTWQASKDVTSQKALLLGADSDNRVFFQPGAGMSGLVNDAITFRAWDRSRGEEGQFLGINTTVNGGESPFSAQTETVGLNVTAPVVMDLNRDGQLSYSQLHMDVNSDGQMDLTAWAAPQDGVLVWDQQGDGLVHDHSQFAFAQYAGFAGATDLQGLAAAFDGNGDGVFDSRDALFSQFAVWQDQNQNGTSDAGEVRNLADWGINAIGLNSDGVVRTPAAGVEEAGRSTAQMADGTQMLVADAAFAFQTLDTPAADLKATGPQLDLTDFVSRAAAQPVLPADTQVKLFLYDMIQGAKDAPAASEYFSAAEAHGAMPDSSMPVQSMDLLAEQWMRQILG